MEASERISLEQVQLCLNGSEGIQFEGRSRAEIYEWVSRILRQHGYERLGGPARGLIRAYIGKVRGLGLAQVTRFVRSFVEAGRKKRGRIGATGWRAGT